MDSFECRREAYEHRKEISQLEETINGLHDALKIVWRQVPQEARRELLAGRHSHLLQDIEDVS